MRPDSKKLLVVITDGRSNDPKDTFDAVIPLAEQMGVARYAIGVTVFQTGPAGHEFDAGLMVTLTCSLTFQVGKDYSMEELLQIASSPSNVFESDSFDALNSIQEQVKEKLFSIEGRVSGPGVEGIQGSFLRECRKRARRAKRGTRPSKQESYVVKVQAFH